MIKIWLETLKKNGKTMCKNIAVYYLIFIYWEVLLYLEQHGTAGISIWNLLFLLPAAIFLTSLTGWSSNYKKTNIAAETILLFAVSAFYIVELIYYRTFGSLLSVSMIGAGGDAMANFGWSVSATIRESVGRILLFEVPVLLRLGWSLTRGTGIYDACVHPFLQAAALLVWVLVAVSLPLAGMQDYTAYGAYHSRYVDTDTASAKLGALPNFIVELKSSVFGTGTDTGFLQAAAEDLNETEEEKETILYNEYEGLDFGRLEDLTDDDVTKALCSYLGSVQPSRQNEYTGLFEGYNLIYICAESFSSMAIDEEITPTLYKMANSGIVLNNYYNSFRNTTTNGEYAFLTGLWPDVARQNTNMGVVTGTMGQSIEKDMSIALGNTFAFSEGLSGRAYHNYYGYYYGRNQSLPNMGFTCKFMDDGMHFTTAWPSSDYELMEQSVDDYIDSDRFLTYYMTFSGHGNYTTNNVMVARNYDHVSEMVDDDIDYTALGYLSCHYELEKAMAYLLERLEDAGKLDNTVIVLTGDHYPYYLSDEGYEDLRGEPVDEDFGSYKSTCIIYNAGLGRTISVDTPCCNVDILPTIYNLFNVQYDSRLYAGTDIFGDGLHMAELYNKSFISEYVKYNYATGETTWLVDENRYDRGFLDHHLESALLTAKNRYAMSIEVEETDFYKFVFDNYQRKQRVAKDAEETEQVDAYTGHMKDSE